MTEQRQGNVLHLSVILFVVGACSGGWGRHACPGGVCAIGGACAPRGMCDWGMHGKGGMHGKRGMYSKGGMHGGVHDKGEFVGKGGHAW